MTGYWPSMRIPSGKIAPSCPLEYQSQRETRFILPAHGASHIIKFVIAQLVIGQPVFRQFNKPIAFKVVNFKATLRLHIVNRGDSYGLHCQYFIANFPFFFRYLAILLFSEIVIFMIN